MASVTTPYQEHPVPDTSYSPRGCRTPLRGPRPPTEVYRFSIYCANPFLLFLRPLLMGLSSHSPALSPSAPSPSGRPLQHPLLRGGGCRHRP
nr:MAG TPA: hypothetical protein [Caudoviricetes sp.]